ncbi:MAG: 6-phosphogluconolactonase [Verrucomicrobiota bacterium]
MSRNSIFKTPDDVARSAGEILIEQAGTTLAENGRFTVALSGGSTPKRMYDDLAQRGEHHDLLRKIDVFWGDERHVPPDHPDSNFGAAKQHFLDRLDIPDERVHRIPAEEADADRAAERYERTLIDFFQLGPKQVPRFDLIFLGMGPDGHTASIFPGTTAVQEADALVTAPWVEKFDTHRITLTWPVINNAKRVIFLVTGGDKAETLHEVQHGEHDPDRLPSQLIAPDEGELLWMLDEAAASALPGS